MKRLKALAIAALLAAPAGALAQVYTTYEVPPAAYPAERITIYEPHGYTDFVIRESGALQSGAGNPADAMLAHSVAMAIGDDPRLDDAAVTVSANNGRVAISGLADPQQNEIAQQVARSVAGNVSGALSSDLG